MANGQQKSKVNLAAFLAWSATQTDDDYGQIIHNGRLNRGEMATAIGIGKSALRQNPQIARSLEQLEDGLRARGVLPSLTQAAELQTGQPQRYEQGVNRNSAETQRLGQLEQENIELKAQLAELQAKLRRYGELSEVLSEFGICPQ